MYPARFSCVANFSCYKTVCFFHFILKQGYFLRRDVTSPTGRADPVAGGEGRDHGGTVRVPQTQERAAHPGVGLRQHLHPPGGGAQARHGGPPVCQSARALGRHQHRRKAFL